MVNEQLSVRFQMTFRDRHLPNRTGFGIYKFGVAQQGRVGFLRVMQLDHMGVKAPVAQLIQSPLEAMFIE